MTAPEEDLAEEALPGAYLGPDERDLEAPPEDALEQATPVEPIMEPIEIQRGLEVSEYDAVEQARVVELDDDYER